MPIHLRAEPGAYADAVLLPGDPLRAKYIADTYLEDVTQVNGERGLLGFTGTWEGRPVSVQGTGMGCPGATIVFEELIQLGCTKLMRVGTCGGLQPHHALGDLIVALTAVPADSTAMHLVNNEPHCPTASWELIHGAVHAAKEMGQPMHVGPIVSSDVFYNPDTGQYERWSQRGVLAVEMEAAALFTVAALGGIGKTAGVHAGCLLTVSDIVVEGVFTRITDEELRDAVDRVRERIDELGGSNIFLTLRDVEDEVRQSFVDGFRSNSAKEYSEIVEECETKFVKEIEFERFRENYTFEEAEEIRQDLEKLRRWLEKVEARDWMGADGRDAARAKVADCEVLLEHFEAEVYERHSVEDDLS
jgi:DeoD family purine-nucleoside phosphorylase